MNSPDFLKKVAAKSTYLQDIFYRLKVKFNYFLQPGFTHFTTFFRHEFLLLWL